LIFTNATKIWKANNLFTPDWFKENFGNRTTEVGGKEYTMIEVMEMVHNSTVEKPAPYPIKYNIPKQIPEILPLIEPLDLNFAKPNWFNNSGFKRGNWGNVTELFIGGPGGKFPYVHIDYYHLSAWINQLYGQKEFIVFPRGQEDFLYINPKENWKSTVDIFNPDYEKHPKYKNATPIHFVLGPGESLYIPFGTWHTAYSLTPTISVAFDQLSKNNFKYFMKDVWEFHQAAGLPKAAIRYSYAWLAGQVCKIQDLLPGKIKIQ
jgi:histone arginine demethylase JMJD6